MKSMKCLFRRLADRKIREMLLAAAEATPKSIMYPTPRSFECASLASIDTVPKAFATASAILRALDTGYRPDLGCLEHEMCLLLAASLLFFRNHGRLPYDAKGNRLYAKTVPIHRTVTYTPKGTKVAVTKTITVSIPTGQAFEDKELSRPVKAAYWRGRYADMAHAIGMFLAMDVNELLTILSVDPQLALLVKPCRTLSDNRCYEFGRSYSWLLAQLAPISHPSALWTLRPASSRPHIPFDASEGEVSLILATEAQSMSSALCALDAEVFN